MSTGQALMITAAVITEVHISSIKVRLSANARVRFGHRLFSESADLYVISARRFRTAETESQMQMLQEEEVRG